MKNMILHIAITTLLASMSACSDEMDPVLRLGRYSHLLPIGRRAWLLDVL